MRPALSIVVALVILSVVHLRAADWTLRLAEFPDGKPLAVMSMSKPFLVILTNKSGQSYSLWDWGMQLARNLDVSFLFKDERQESFPVRITGPIDMTWNPGYPKTVAPGESFAIKVDFSEGNWINLDRLKGKMTVVVTYESYFPMDPTKIKSARDQTLPPGLHKVVVSESIPLTMRP